MNFSKNLVELRKVKGLTPVQIAQLLGIDVELYQEYEVGIKQPSMQHINTISNFYGIDAYDLVNGKTKGGKASSSVVYNNTRKLNITLIILSALLFVIAFFPIVYYYLEVNNVRVGLSEFSIYGIIDNFTAKYVVMCVLLLIVSIWDIVDSVLLLLPVSFTYGVYSKISKSVRLISGIAEALIFTILAIMLNELTYSYMFLIFIAYYIIKLVFKIVSSTKIKKTK